ncbi:MAG: hypothetical protein B7Y39_14070 [Bdellovibrio sp. 28-41-41]|nr:MAG: hypothetical protein B7Y39_14070 [Bdellovibrio sp. 28-41-41]
MFIHSIALRNLFKNKYRTFVSILMISGALVGVTLFRGYVLRTLDVIQTTIVNGQFGHLQLGTSEYWSQDYKNKKDVLLGDHKFMIEKIASIPGVTAASPRMKFYGLLSTEQMSDSAMLIGIDPAKEKTFSVGLNMIEGKDVNVEDKKILVGTSLAKRLKLKLGDSVTLVASTLDQVVNAMDFQISGIFATGAEEFDSVAAFINIIDAQKVMNSTAVDVVKISVSDVSKLEEVKSRIENKFIDKKIEVRTWYQISSLFRKVESFYNTQTGLMFSILVFIVLLGISNTVSMSLNERIGEIGTLRALGQSRLSLFNQFMLESFYLCFAALSIGAVISFFVTKIVNMANLTAEIPGASIPMPIEIGFYPQVVAGFGVALFFIVNFFTAILVIKFIRIKIVESLRHNI